MKIFLLLSFLFLSACTDSTTNSGNTTDNSKKECTLPWGGLLKHGESVDAFKDPVAEKPNLCIPEKRTCNDGHLSGVFVHKSCEQKEVEQNPNEEKPLATDFEGKKIGSVKVVTSELFWRTDDWHGNAPACDPNADVNGKCTEQGATCKKSDNTKLYCEKKTKYKVYGWVYEKEGTQIKPLLGVKLDLFWFAGCLAGMCKMSPDYFTNENGYFEFYTDALLDSVRIQGKPGYFGLCQNNAPINGGGEHIGNKVEGSSVGPYLQYKVKPDSCKYGMPQ